MLFRSDRKSTRLNSSHTIISYAVFCLKKKRSARHFFPSSPPLLMPCLRRLARWAVELHLVADVLDELGTVDEVWIKLLFFFFNDRAPPEICPLSLHGPLPI